MGSTILLAYTRLSSRQIEKDSLYNEQVITESNIFFHRYNARGL